MKKIFLVGIIGSALLCGCTANAMDNATAPDASSVVTDGAGESTVQETQATPSVYYLAGRVKASQSADVSVPFTGQISEVLVSVGDSVKRGDPLIRFESSEVEAKVEVAQQAVLLAMASYERAQQGARPEQLEQAKSNLNVAKSNYENSVKELERQKTLYEAGAISNNTLENYTLKTEGAEAAYVNATEALSILETGESKTYLNVLEKQIDQAKASLSVVEVALEKMTVTAPFDAVVVDIPVRSGESYLYKTCLVTLENQNILTVDAYGPASAVAHFVKGDAVSVRIAECPDEVMAGTVEWIGNSIDAKRQDVLVRVALNASPELMAGMFAEIAPSN
ncbi:MAG: efflux RND transporter periplasmic adaptor subunit [Clostridia bacterium]|nr:efflux RND transporter periplasmic adaptor subunit [Clostridia bacterium]